MPRLSKFTPATAWRAFFVFAILAPAGFGASAKGPSAAPDLAQLGKPDAVEAQRILEEFRRSGIPGQYFLEFELHALPRRGATVVYRGRFWGGRNEQGAISRVELTDGNGKIHRLLIQNGERPAVWRFAAGGEVQEIGAAARFEPVIPGVEITAFDLQQPFLYWPDATLQKIARVRGRPANAYLFRAPPGFAAQAKGVAAARAYLDTQFNALMQTELLDANERVLKTTALVDLKKIVDPATRQEQWIPKSLDVRNEVTRDKTRFLVTAAALNLQLLPAIFEPATLSEPIQPPSGGRVVRLDR